MLCLGHNATFLLCVALVIVHWKELLIRMISTWCLIKAILVTRLKHLLYKALPLSLFLHYLHIEWRNSASNPGRRSNIQTNRLARIHDGSLIPTSPSPRRQNVRRLMVMVRGRDTQASITAGYRRGRHYVRTYHHHTLTLLQVILVMRRLAERFLLCTAKCGHPSVTICAKMIVMLEVTFLAAYKHLLRRQVEPRS